MVMSLSAQEQEYIEAQNLEEVKGEALSLGLLHAAVAPSWAETVAGLCYRREIHVVPGDVHTSVSLLR